MSKRKRDTSSLFSKYTITLCIVFFALPEHAFVKAQAGFAVGRGFDSRHLQCYGDVAQW